jgi:predicted alpha-1,2-mannosidase
MRTPRPTFFWISSLGLLMVGCAMPNKHRFVNPFIGTDGTGHTFPGPCYPFGMVQPGPDNADIGWNHSSGYQYRDTTLLGFSQTRCNGTGINEFGDVLLKPLTSDTQANLPLNYRKETERAAVGHYSVTLANEVTADLTCSERVSFHRYTFPTQKGKLLLDLQHGLRFLTDSLVLQSHIEWVDSCTVRGYCHTKNWVERKYFFAIVFETPFTQHTTLPRRRKENAPRSVLDFSLPKNKQLQVKVALSTLSMEGAMQNLQTEIPHWQFHQIVRQNQQQWDALLNRVTIKSPREQKHIFYSALYRLFIQPNNIADVDGRYRGANDSIAKSATGNYYSTLSLWDTYRATHPLYTLLAPERVNDFVNSMLEHGKAAGFLPIWSAWGKDNYCMIGNHAIPVIADAYFKKFNGFDHQMALNLMIKSSIENHINSDWTLLNQYGYYPFDRLENEAVSRTLEHGVDDYFLGKMALRLGDSITANLFLDRSQNYKRLYDPSTHQFRGKNSLGTWRYPFDPLEATSPMNNPGDYTEANAWQYFWTPAQYDVPGLTQLLGGEEALSRKLDTFFSLNSPLGNKFLGQEAMIGQYAHGNEPSHHVAYLYRFSSQPQKTEALLKQICGDFYKNQPDGLIGNDDCGQMSAWYIFTTLGFYPVNPGEGSYTLGVPQCRKAILHLSNGKKIQITNQSRETTTFNGKALNTFQIQHRDLINGGSLRF